MSKSKGEGDIESGSSQASSVFNTGADSAQLPPQITAQLAARAAAQTRPRLRRHGTSRSGAGGKSSTRLQYEELQDLVQDLPVDQHKQVIASQSSSGYLADYIERRKASEGKWKLSNERWLYYYIHSKPKTFFGEAARHAKGLLLREQLECDLMSSIVLERKKEKVMPATGLKEFVAQAQNILTMKRTLGTIRASVWNWELNVRLLEFGYRGDQDLVLTRMADRRWRNESFWSMFHDRARDHRPEEKEAFDELPEEGLQAYHTLSRFNQTVQQQLWSSQHGCPGSNTKATGPAQRLPVDMSREHQNVSDQRPSTLRWVPPPRPQSAVSGSRSALRRCQTTPNLREHVRPASAGSTAKRESHLGLADGRFFRRTIGSAAQSLPILEKPRVIASDRKDMLRSISSRPTSAGSSRGNVKRPSSAGSWATASRPQSAVSRRRTKEWKMPETEPTPSLWSPADPWPASPQRGKSRHQAPPSCQKYLQACQLHATVPDTLDFNTGLSDKLSAPRRYICDADLLAVAGMLPARDHVDAVDLQENSNLTDLSLVPLLEQFVKVDRLAEGLRRLNLKYCKGINWLGQETLLRLMSSAKNLRELDLSGVPIGMRVQRRLCVAVGDHPHLMSIGLARVGLGGHMLTKDCLHSLLGSQSNQRLDLSWNVFNKQEFQLVGDFIAENLVLEHLLLDHCAGYIAREDTPISHLVEKLAFNHALRSLSVCTDRIDSRAALVIEDSLEGHPTLKRLYLRNNPLGIMGLRSILRLLCREESHLSRLDIEGCHGGKSGDEVICLEGSAAQESKVFSFTNPGGKYVLDLSIPYDRSLCRMLYETAERFELKHSKAFVNINYSIPPYQHPIRDSIGQYKVRREGILTFTFNVESAIAAKWSEIADDDFITFLNAHLELMRFTPHRIKMRPLLANWKAISGMPMEQETFLTALASDFNMILPYLEYMVQACPEAGTQTLFRLIPSLKRDGSSMYLATALFPEMEDFLVTVREMEAYMLFNPQNPTGHYKLKLENSTDFAVAQQLLLLDRWESVVNKRNRRQDVSQRGNQSQLRNECHMGRSLHLSVKMLTEWVIPEFGEFECDYVTSNHPKKGSKPLSDDLWEELMMCMYDSPCEPQDRLKVLKTISHQIFLSSLHIRQMVGFFRNDLDREDALVFFWPRVVDKYNAKVFRVRFEKQEDVVRLQERLGYASFFPFIQPENAKFRYNMAVYEQRLAASLIVTLAQRENPGNIKGYNASENLPTFERPDGTFDPLTMGVPRSWADFKQCPTKGIFSGSYKCAPENRDYEFRRRLAETYGYYDSKIMASTREQDIMWWTGLMEPPEDILDLLEFLISRFQNVDEAFRKIVRISDTKSEQITLRRWAKSAPLAGPGRPSGPPRERPSLRERPLWVESRFSMCLASGVMGLADVT
ncbi:unnamed protein product [Durusdinium trenchii]|uniref:Uncharacterized protein n=2 Tax=Durusdinium trenchii TaxID=1381693 RepID=A0ABP0JCI2_9DINO